MQKIIEYEDKEALYENPNIPDKNKVKSDDMNEIKLVVNGSLQGTNAMGSIVVDDVICKNIYNGLYELGAYDTTTGQKVTNNLCYRNVMPIAVKPLTNYVFSLNGTKITEIGRIFYLDANGSMLSTETFTGTFTTPTNCYYVNWHSTALKTDYPSELSNAQIEQGSEATSYTSYKTFDNQEVYSLGEQIVGTYDDKTLYRQTIIATPNIASGTASASFTIPIANVDQVFIKDMTKIADTSSSGYVYGFPFITGSASIGGYISVGTSNLTFNVRKTTNVGFYSIKLVLEYTKATSGTRSIETAEEENDNR